MGRVAHRAQEDEEARRARDQVRLALVAYGTDEPDEFALRALVEVEDVAMALHRPGGLVVANAGFRHLDERPVVRGRLTATLTAPVPPRLESGELDFFDETVAACVLHHAVVRAADSRVRFVVTAMRSIDDPEGRPGGAADPE